MPTLELRHMRCFISVAKHLHFSRAAEELGIAAPSLTKLIQQAEQLLGVRLFLRTKRTVALTAAGSAYLAEVLTAFEHLSRGEELAVLAERGELGRIEVGFVSSAAYAGVLQHTIRGFKKSHPRIEIAIHEVVMERITSMLTDGQLDVAYLRPPMHYPENIRATTVYHDTFIAAIPADSKLAALHEVSPSQLRDQTFVVPEQEFGTFEVARRGRFVPTVTARPGPLSAVLAHVSLGGDVAIVPRTLALCVTLPGVEFRPITGKPVPSEVAMAYRRHERAPAVQAFQSYVMRFVAQSTP
jgi:DNA-binding transcriptional LysR family regulator